MPLAALPSRAIGALTCALVLATTASAPADAAAAPAAPVSDPLAYVNPFIGTEDGGGANEFGGGAANTFPGPTAPFGMIQPGPDTVNGLLGGGYNYKDNRIRGFSMTHLSGPGCTTYQDVPIMPFVGDVTKSPATNPDAYVSTFSHANESASVGSYKVKLDNGVTTDLTATTRTAMARLTYPASPKATLLVDASGSIMGVQDAQVSIGKDTVSGHVVSGSFCGDDNRYKLYYTMKFDRPFASIGTWRNDVVTPGLASQTKIKSNPKLPKNATAQKTLAEQAARGDKPAGKGLKPLDTTVSGPGSGGYVQFDTSQDQDVQVRVGISFVSVENAAANLKAESGNAMFEKLRDRTVAAWRKRLNRVKIAGGTEAERTNFYTALYHSLVAPNTFSDANGEYTGFDGRLHSVEPGHTAYSNFSGWDIYRSQVQLVAMLDPAVGSDIAQTMIDFAEQGGAWDRWTVANDFNGVMTGDPYHAIVSTMYAFGARDFDAGRGLQLMVKGATTPTKPYVERPGLQNYLVKGYIPHGEPGVWGGAGTTLEYTTADFAIAQLADRLGHTATRDEFMRRAQFWQNLFNPATNYIQPREADGAFKQDFKPASMDGYAEGSGAQYHWMVPYNARGLFASMGGNAEATKRLDHFFTELHSSGASEFSNMSNEPSFEVPWMYAWAGAPHKTQQVVRRTINELFKPTPNGMVGNDDLGALSSWYVWAALGMYPQIPGRAEMALASPLFTRITIDRPGGQRITIKAPEASTKNYYVENLRVNGKWSTKPWLPESFITSGGTLNYTLRGTPNETWGSAAADEPPSFRAGEVRAQPYVDPGRITVEPGTSGTTKFGVRSTGEALTVGWKATPPAGITLSPASGNIEAPANGTGTADVRFEVASDITQGYYQVPVTFTTASGAALGSTSVLVVAAKPGSLFAAYNNAGISTDAAKAAANVDGYGYSYSREALTAAGAKPGGAVKSGDFTFTWPNTPAGQFDNATLGGQTINLSDTAGKTKLALLGTATGGKGSGTVTIIYTDGTTQNADIAYSDWTLGGGASPVDPTNTVAIESAYRNRVDGTSQNIKAYVFATTPIALQAGKQVASVKLPATSSGGTVHIFDVALA